MLSRMVMIGLAGLSLVMLARWANAAEETHEGKVISVGAAEIVVLDNRDGDNDRFVVTAETKVTRNGKPAKLSEILAGDRAKVVAGSSDGKLVAKSIDARAPE